MREDNVLFITPTGLNSLSRLAVYVPSDYQTLTLLEWVNGEWHPFAALPHAANRRSNAIYFKKSFFAKIGLSPSESKRRILFADLFATHRWQRPAQSACTRYKRGRAVATAGRVGDESTAVAGQVPRLPTRPVRLGR